MAENTEGMLTAYRVLDLADEKGLMCGKILGDLGADVIKIEKPGGDPARNLGPFYHNETEPEKSLFWFALNTSKRGITLALETADGREIFERLVKGADFVIETSSPGYMDSLGLGYTDLEKINPEVILVSITPFGQTGPYRDWKTSDIVAWALGGYLAPFGEGDRPPIQIGHHSQAYLHAGADGAMGALAALFARGSTGEGQHVDVSIHESVAQCAESLSGVKGVARRLRQQGKETTTGASPDPAHFWPCKDGYVCWSYGNARITPCRPLINWMAFKGMATDFLKEFDWERPDFMDVYQQERQRIDEPTAAFFMAHTKAELLEEAIEHKVMLYPVSTTADMLANLQLSEREFWIELEHPELGVKLTYPGVFANTSNAQLRMTRRAPLIGEHNREIYQDELGILAERLSAWEQNGVI